MAQTVALAPTTAAGDSAAIVVASSAVIRVYGAGTSTGFQIALLRDCDGTPEPVITQGKRAIFDQDNLELEVGPGEYITRKPVTSGAIGTLHDQ